MKKMKFRIYVINASDKEQGVWLNLPMTFNELDAALEKIGASVSGNYIIMDTEVELPFTYEIGEDTSIDYINSIAMQLSEINCKGDLDWLAAYMVATGDSLEASLDNYENHSVFCGTIELY